MKNVYAAGFIPVLALVVLAVVGFLGLYTMDLLSTPTADPQVAAGAARIVGASTAAEQAAVVSSGAVPLAPSEEARPLPGGQPDNLPPATGAGAPATP